MGQDRNAPDGRGVVPPLRSGSVQVRLSSLSKRDIPRVVEIETACYSEPWSFDSFRQVLEDPRTFGTLAARMDRDLLVGYIIYSEVVDELHILNVATDPHYRRKGIATAMLLYLHQAALRRGRKVAFLEVRRSNLTAQQLYAKFGYRPVGKRTDYYSDTHEDAIIMTADLRKEKA